MLVSGTWITEDEEFLAVERMLEEIANVLHGVNMDTYNKRYLVRLVVEEVHLVLERKE